MKKKDKKKVKIKFDLQKVFNYSSFFFILGCIIIYGSTFIKLYLENEKELEKWLSLPDAHTGELLCDNYDLAI